MRQQQALFGAFQDTTTDINHGRLSVLTWNIQHAAPKRVWRQVAWLAAQPGADIVALTEVGSGHGAQTVSEALAYYGYEVQVPRDESSDYCVVLATRIGRMYSCTLAPDHLPHRGIVGRIEVPGWETVTVTGVYVPSRDPKERRNVAKRGFQDSLARMVPRLLSEFGSNGPVLIAGDLNVVEPGHQPHHNVFGEWEYEFYRSFAKTGFVDCFRHLHRDANDYSWYGRSGLGFRFDHLFISAAYAARLEECEYQHGPRIDKLSDHSVMKLSIGPALHT